ncbi:MAG: proliferating cell nuclear antigen (pcna) [Candidatus Aenigmatarchaeota archaeon]|nr:MAG: proliferating cell nuclear antigen (pcna) [Candidatus Aenigmarchaeota archaeon]
MFKAVLTEAELLKNSIPIVAEIIDEGVFKVNQNGINLLSPDRAMVSVVDFKILSTAFESFTAESSLSLGLNLTHFVNVLKRVRSSDKLALESAKDGNKLRISLEGNGKRVFEIPVLDVKEEKPPIDQLQFKGRIEIESEILENGIADAEVIGDSVVFEANPESFKMYAKGDVSSAELELRKNDSGLLKLEVTENIRARYPLEYLKKMIKAAKLSNQASLEFATDYPLKMQFKSIDKLHLGFILAPRVED